MSFFAYHSGERALVFAHHVTGKPVGVKVADLIRQGWKITDGGCVVSLPRFEAKGPSRIVAPTSRDVSQLRGR